MLYDVKIIFDKLYRGCTEYTFKREAKSSATARVETVRMVENGPIEYPHVVSVSAKRANSAAFRDKREPRQ